MTVDPNAGSRKVAVAERDIEIRRCALDIAKMLRDFTCEERQQIEQRVKDLVCV